MNLCGPGRQPRHVHAAFEERRRALHILVNIHYRPIRHRHLQRIGFGAQRVHSTCTFAETIFSLHRR
jgi:hypothetical protein